MNTILTHLYLTILAIDLNWSDITDPIHDMFMGNETREIIGMFGGDEMLLGMLIFIILFVITLLFGLGMLVGSVVIIPTLFAIFQYVPDLKIIVAIISGLMLGIGFHKIIKR